MYLRIFILLNLFLLSVNLNANDKWIVKAGLNYSEFRDDKDSEFISGYTISVLKSWHLINDMSLEFGLGYSTRGGILNNKVVKTFSSVSGQLENVYSYNLSCSINYLDFPLNIKYKLNIKDINFHFYSGFYLSIPLSSVNSEVKRSKNQFLFIYVNSIPGQNDYKFEYNISEDSGYGVWWGRILDSNYGINFGIGSEISHYVIDFLYKYDLKSFGSNASLIHVLKRSHSFHFLFGLEL